MKKELNEIINTIDVLIDDNYLFIDNSGKRWLDFAKVRIGRLYGLSEREISSEIFKDK